MRGSARSHFKRREMQTLRLELNTPFGISREISDYKLNTFIYIDDGIGEAAPSTFYGESSRTVEQAAQRFLKEVPDDPFAIEGTLANIERIVPAGDSAAKAAIDMALHDRLGKRLDCPLHRLWGLSAAQTPVSSFTIGLDTKENMLERVSSAREYPILKIKMGTKDDLDILRAIREITDQTIRIDANGGWQPDEALKKIDAMRELDIELIEQPLPPSQNKAMRSLRKKTEIPLFADESCCRAADIPTISEYFDGVNIKLMKCGGLREASRSISTARACGLAVMIGCMIESSVANSAAAQLSPLADYADLDGHVLIANDPYEGMKLEQGRIVLPDRPGIGVVERIS